MANYCCVVRTNYFHVKDEDKFKELMSRVYGSEDIVDLWEEKDADGNTVFGFGCYGGIAGVANAKEDEDDDCDETSYDEFIDGLQECVADNDAIIIMEAGNEKLRYVIGAVSVITNKDYKYKDTMALGYEMAQHMLNNREYRTQMDY